MTDPLDDLFADDPAGLAGAVMGLACDIPSVTPPLGVRDRLLAAVRCGSPPVFTFAADAHYHPTRHPVVSVCVLHTDRQRNCFTCILKLDPGASLPAHVHDGPVECLVLEGTVTVGSVTQRPGDYQRCDPGSDHAVQFSEAGAVLYITASLSLLSA